MYPKNEQKEMFNQHFGACRFIYNWGLEQKIHTFQQTGETISSYTLNRKITELKKIEKWLYSVNSQSLQGATLNLDKAFKNFFINKNGFPRLKSKKNPVQSFKVPQHYKIDFKNNKIYLPKIGWIKTKIHRKFIGKQKTATLTMTNTGKYYISVLVDDGNSKPLKEEFTDKTTIGLDMGLTHFLTTSESVKVESPQPLKNQLRKLRRAHRKLSNKQKGSQNWEKQSQIVAKIHEKIKDVRKDFHHKLSIQLVRENQAISVENLNIKGLLKNHSLAQKIIDSGWYSFIEKLKYKCDWYGKTFLQIGLFDPSSKLCNKCSYKNQELKLKHHHWTCPVCRTKHDRDINAAKNIKNIALNKNNKKIVPQELGELKLPREPIRTR